MARNIYCTGRYNTTVELIESVLRSYYYGNAKVADISRQCRCSPGVVSKIVNGNYYIYVKTRYGSIHRVRFFFEEDDVYGYIENVKRTIQWVRYHTKTVRKPKEM